MVIWEVPEDVAQAINSEQQETRDLIREFPAQREDMILISGIADESERSDIGSIQALIMLFFGILAKARRQRIPLGVIRYHLDNLVQRLF